MQDFFSINVRYDGLGMRAVHRTFRRQAIGKREFTGGLSCFLFRTSGAASARGRGPRRRAGAYR